MTYLKLTVLLIFTLSVYATADTSPQNDINEPPHESHMFSSVSAFFNDTAQYFTQLFDGWFEPSQTPETDNHRKHLAVQSVSAPNNQTPAAIVHNPVPTQELAQAEISINDKISKLEQRRLAIEERRLAAEEKRLAATERRLAAAEQRLAAEEARLAAEEKKLLTKDTNKQIASSDVNNPFAQLSHQQPAEQNSLPLTPKKKPVKEQKKLTSVVSTTKNPAFIKLENQYYLDLYKWELKTEIYRLVKYPDWAKSLGKKGNVQLNFTVGRDTRVSKVNGDNAQVSIQLITELHRAIMAAAKRVLPPDALPGNSWEMSIAYNFQPTKVEQVALEKPSKPLFLDREESTVLISSDNNLEKYQEDVQGIIRDRIEYPVWAEKLKQKGKVSFEIVINKDGSIAEIKPKEVNRHLFLNQEVLKAINESAPLPSIPEHLRLHSTNMVIQHDFKKH